LTAPVNLVLQTIDAAVFSVRNENLLAGEAVTGFFFCLYLWSGGRYV